MHNVNWSRPWGSLEYVSWPLVVFSTNRKKLPVFQYAEKFNFPSLPHPCSLDLLKFPQHSQPVSTFESFDLAWGSVDSGRERSSTRCMGHSIYDIELQLPFSCISFLILLTSSPLLRSSIDVWKQNIDSIIFWFKNIASVWLLPP